MNKDTVTIKKTTLREWVNRLIAIRNNGDETQALHDLIDLESTILGVYR